VSARQVPGGLLARGAAKRPTWRGTAATQTGDIADSTSAAHAAMFTITLPPAGTAPRWLVTVLYTLVPEDRWRQTGTPQVLTWG
jgi:hypothetical protein